MQHIINEFITIKVPFTIEIDENLYMLHWSSNLKEPFLTVTMDTRPKYSFFWKTGFVHGQGNTIKEALLDLVNNLPKDLN